MIEKVLYYCLHFPFCISCPGIANWQNCWQLLICTLQYFIIQKPVPLGLQNKWLEGDRYEPKRQGKAGAKSWWHLWSCGVTAVSFALPFPQSLGIGNNPLLSMRFPTQNTSLLICCLVLPHTFIYVATKSWIRLLFLKECSLQMDSQTAKNLVCLVQVSDEYCLGRRYILYSKIPVLVTNFKETKLISPTRDVVSESSSCLVTSTFDIQRQAEMRFENKTNNI